MRGEDNLRHLGYYLLYYRLCNNEKLTSDNNTEIKYRLIPEVLYASETPSIIGRAKIKEVDKQERNDFEIYTEHYSETNYGKKYPEKNYTDTLHNHHDTN